MAQVRAGRVERLAAVFERHHRHLFHFFWRLTGHRGVSEDLAQEVFLRLLRYRASYRPGSPFLPWMWRIARNVHQDHLQTLRAHVPLEEVKDGVADDREGADVHMMRDQDVIRLSVALERLEPTKRELLLLSRNPDMAYKDLAELMACSVGAVKVQVHRALKELKTAFGALEGGRS